MVRMCPVSIGICVQRAAGAGHVFRVAHVPRRREVGRLLRRAHTQVKWLYFNLNVKKGSRLALDTGIPFLSLMSKNAVRCGTTAVLYQVCCMYTPT